MTGQRHAADYQADDAAPAGPPLRPSRAVFAAAMIGLGITGLVNGDFALFWQKIPVDHLPARTAIAYVCALTEFAAGLGLLLKSTVTLACRLLFAYLLLWILLLELPALLSTPLKDGAWGTFGEIMIIAAGAWCLFASHAGAWERRHLKFAVGEEGIRAARLLLILSLPLIGLQVIVAGADMGNNVMPMWLRWLPYAVDWAYLSGIGSLAACLGLLLGIFPRLAATMEAAMLAIITILFWGVDLQTGRTANTAFFISAAIAAGVWVVADTYRGADWLATGRESRVISLE